MSKMDEVFDLVVRGKAKLIGAAVQEALDEGNAAPDVLDNMIKAMGVVGERFKNNEIFVPEMLVAARAMKKGVDVLKPHLAGGSAGVAGKMIIGTVAGGLHDIGMNLVAMMIESAGFEVIDLGVDVPVCAEQIVTGVIISESQIVPVILQGAFIEHSHALKAVHTHREVFVVELLQKENAELKRKLEHMNEVFANAQRVRFGQSRGKNSFVDARGSILTSRILVAFHTKL